MIPEIPAGQPINPDNLPGELQDLHAELKEAIPKAIDHLDIEIIKAELKINERQKPILRTS